MDAESEPFYCLPVGTNANLQNGVLATQNSTQLPGGAATNNMMKHNSAWSQPTSPSPGVSRGLNSTLSPTAGGTLPSMSMAGVCGMPATTSGHRLTYPKKNDEGKKRRNLLEKI